MRVQAFFLLLFSTFAWSQTPTFQVTDLVNVRNFAISNDGADVFWASGRNTFSDIQGSVNVYRVHYSDSVNFLSYRVTDYPEVPLTGVSYIAYPGSGTRLAYSYVRDNAAQQEEIHVLDYSGGTDRLLATDRDGCPRVQCIDCYTVCTQAIHVSPDGKTVLYSMLRNQPFYTALSDGTARQHLSVYQGTLAASGQRVITDSGKVVFTSAAPAGPTLAAAATDVYVMNVDGSNIQQVTHLPTTSAASEAVISAGGEWIAFLRTDGSNPAQVWMIRPDGTGLRQVSASGGAARSPSISLDGSVLTFVQNGQVKQVSTNSSDLTRLTISAAQNVVVAGNGKRVALSLGPSWWPQAAIYTAPVNATTSFSDLNMIHAPRVIFPNGIVSAGGTAPPSIGSLMTAYGINLSRQELATAAQFPLPTTLGGIQMLNDTDVLALQAVTPWQVNAQLPQSLRPGTIQLRIREGDTLIGDGRTVAKATAPEAIPMYSISGTGPLLAAVLFSGTTILPDAAHPASSSDNLEIYALGLGVTTPRVAAGVASPVANADVKPRVLIGGRDAELSYWGLVPGFAGVYQVNMKIPSGLAPGYQPLRWVNTDGSITGTSGIYVR